ncbi:MAG: DNA translocase FtsK 4TM domain-containing protein [Cypionkella sp.]|uniref:DNA translocase FtsK n=1 Tax=Cypionkella sp. TaxID=2811411 RepID=UPI002ABB6A8B|nr:DNA translocase FtsK 4TM domain-containing protein [Cypionkella sp.]MDZ4310126.1 DNA translocase FtsK 4TM domain-containing protein [Cypionkella sp.]
MASYQARQRDPLLDQGTTAMLERRGRELLGLALIAAAFLFMLMLGSYSPEDPGWMVATDEPAANTLGRFGAALASTLIIIGGKGAWAIPMILSAWGLRFVLHRGAERAVSRMVFAVIAIAMASIYAATLLPSAMWVHSFGMGGLFGDTVVGALMNIIPGGSAVGLKLISLASGAAMIALMLFVTGFNFPEIRAGFRFLITSLIYSYSILLGAAGKGAQGTTRAAAAIHARRRRNAAEAARPDETLRAPADWREDRATSTIRRAEPSVEAAGFGRPSTLRADARYAEPLAEAPQYAPPREKLGLLARMPALMRRAVDPEPELIEPTISDAADHADMPSDDRIKSRISDAIRSRTRPPEAQLSPLAAAIQRREPPLQRPRGPAPLIADTRPITRIEPPVTAPVVPLHKAPLHNAFVETEDDQAFDLPEDHSFTLTDDAHDYAADEDDYADDYTPAVAPPRPVPTPERRPVVQHAVKKPIAPSARAAAEAQPRLRFDDPAPAYELPPLSLLTPPSSVQRHALSDEALEENARMLENVLDDYGVKGEIVSVRPGPVVTMYELEPAPGLKASRVIGLADDIARSMSALSARVSTVPGRTVIGIELPNATREKVVLREIIAARDFGDSNMRLPLALGKDIGGDPIVANLAKMPHLLIAGTTGSGKSVAINTMILSLLYKLSPEECRLIMIDPKMLELSVYDGIPHLLSPVVTDPKKAVVALKWVVSEMEERYRKMSKMGVRNIEGYNGRVREALAKNEMFKRTIQTGFDEDTGEPMFETDEFQPVTIPYIVVVVDEMADLMMVAGKEIEACIQRLAQMARASGIHLIMATQRPSVDVITGTIKANFPTRISFQVTSKIDSRTILGEQGAEQLLGMGDMLYMAGGGRVSRIHGPFVSDEEVEEIVNHLKSYGPPVYMSGVIEGPEDENAAEIDSLLGLGSDGLDDSLYDQAVAIVAKDRKCSTSYIQRKLGIGYNKAAKLVEQMEEHSVISPANHVGKREILLPEH